MSVCLRPDKAKSTNAKHKSSCGLRLHDVTRRLFLCSYTCTFWFVDRFDLFWHECDANLHISQRVSSCLDVDYTAINRRLSFSLIATSPVSHLLMISSVLMNIQIEMLKQLQTNPLCIVNSTVLLRWTGKKCTNWLHIHSGFIIRITDICSRFNKKKLEFHSKPLTCFNALKSGLITSIYEYGFSE